MTNRHPRLTVALTVFCMTPSLAFSTAGQLVHWREPLIFWGSIAAATIFVGLAAVLPPLIMRLGWLGRVFLSLMLAAILSYNLSNGIGASSMAKSYLTGSRRADNSRLTLLQAQLAQDEASRKELAAAAGGLTLVMADAALATLKQDVRWSRSKECKEATRDDSRAFCADYAQKKAISDAVTKVATLDVQIAELRKQLASAQTATAGESEDPQAEAMTTVANIMGASPTLHVVSILASVQTAVMAELAPIFASVTFDIAFSLGAAAGASAASVAPPAPVRSRPLRWRRSRRGQRRRTNENATGQKADKQRPNGEEAAKIVSTLKNKRKNPDLAASRPPKLPRAERDRRIVQLQASGQSQADIAAKLGVSVRTVRRVVGELQPARSAQKVVPIKRADQAE